MPDRNWLITGVSSGLGRALAQAVLAAGDTVCGTVRSAEAKTAFEALAPGRARGFMLDLRDAAAAGEVVRSVE
ncbi:MAG TPA: SDR family NAD(P)-dependent oxidoreductase, partial [Rhizomicrobium sp.]|nr:SDR family NAD(P)-dependent oxidoreductase [Rhizomicrobium sp.]